MARILISKSENDFLRDLLVGSMHHYVREIDADKTLIESCDEDMLDAFTEMLNRDLQRLLTARTIYNNLLKIYETLR